MEGWQRAFVLHNHPWSETSFVLDVLTEELGCARFMAKGARSKHSNFKGASRPFIPLLLHFGERGEVKALRSAEVVSLALSLSRITLCSGLYINEPIPCALEYGTRSSTLFSDYLNRIRALAGVAGSPESVLRRFELTLLDHLGYGTDFTHYAGSGESAGDVTAYRYRERKGFTASIMIDNATFTGRHLKTLESREFPDADTSHATKRFTRMALEPCLGGRPLKSRELFRQLMSRRE